MPLKINVRELEEHRQPKSETRKFSTMVPAAAVGHPMSWPPSQQYQARISTTYSSEEIYSRMIGFVTGGDQGLPEFR